MTGDPTPDDTLRERLAQIVHDNVCGCRGGLGPCEVPDQDHYEAADALLPTVREHVAAAVQAERERVRQVVKALPHGKTNDTPWVPDFDAGWRHGRMDVLAALDGETTP